MISNVAELEACLGKPSLGPLLKAIDHVDDQARAWVNVSPLCGLSIARKGGAVSATLAGGDPGFATVDGKKILRFAQSALDHPVDASAGDGIATLFVAPGITETLRINGRVSSCDATQIEIAVDECYVHCGKAMIRSGFWTEGAQIETSAMPDAARFCVLATADADGRADASPKGDPAGFLHKIDDETIALPDRTGNRRADGHRNVIVQDRVALVALTPGSTAAVLLQGRARLVNDTAALEGMSVEGKVPQLATFIACDSVEAYESPALKRARVWDADRKAAAGAINASATLVAHVKLSQMKGVQVAAIKLAITPSVTEMALAKDYKDNLY